MRAMRDQVGDLLSERYRLITRVAGGGMGEVYRAHDLLLDRPVAVKILQPTLASDPDLVDRFRAEARAAGRLTYPNIVAVHDWGCEDDRTYYMVMEYVAGSDLRDLLVAHGALAPAQSVEIAASICDALAAAHSSGIVHRDIKPENVLISRAGIVKVADFGIAAVADAERTAPGGAIPGTLRYLSPEQAAGEAATPASDVWATGAVLYEMLTGRPPQAGMGADLLRRRMLEAPDAPSKIDPRVPEDLDEVVLRACAVDPAARFAGAVEMRAALRRVSIRSLPDAPPVQALVDDLTGELRLDDLEPTSRSRSRMRRTRLRQKRRRAARAALVLVALVLLALGAAKAAGSLGGPGKVGVPDLEGLTKSKVSAKLDRAGLKMKVVGRLYSFDVGRGRVLSQTPAAGRVEKGSVVRLWMSKGPRPSIVPSLIGAYRPSAEIRLRASGLELGRVAKRYSLKPAGTVVAQKPRDGHAPWGSEVDVVLSLGPRPVAVPDVAGEKKDAAASKLAAQGFHVSFAKAYSNTVPAGKVISTSPAGGTTADQASTVTVKISMGPRYEELTMPDVRGMSRENAAAKLEDLGLRVTARTCPGGGGTVVETDPIAGSTVRQHDIVALFVCG